MPAEVTIQRPCAQTLNAAVAYQSPRGAPAKPSTIHMARPECTKTGCTCSCVYSTSGCNATPQVHCNQCSQGCHNQCGRGR